MTQGLKKDCASGEIVYKIDGAPIPLARARHGNRKTWDAQKQLKWEISLILTSQHRGHPIYQSVPLHLHIDFYFDLPKSYSNKKALSLYGKPHIFKPDLSNLIKFVEDVATGIIYTDDCVISSISSSKVYDEKARTEFQIWQVK